METEDSDGGVELTPQQEFFCREYIKDLHGGNAAIRAGYAAGSAQQSASRLLSQDKIAHRVQELLKPKMDRYDISAENILKELSYVAYGRMSDVASWNESGVRFKPSDELDDKAIATIEEVSEFVSEAGSTLKIKQYSKTKALELLGKYQKLFTDKVEVSIDEALAKRLSDARKRKESEEG